VLCDRAAASDDDDDDDDINKKEQLNSEGSSVTITVHSKIRRF